MFISFHHLLLCLRSSLIFLRLSWNIRPGRSLKIAVHHAAASVGKVASQACIWSKAVPKGSYPIKLSELKGLCGKLKACQSVGYSGCAGPADEAATLGRACCRLGGDWWWVNGELLLDSPAIALLRQPPLYQSDLKKEKRSKQSSIRHKKCVCVRSMSLYAHSCMTLTSRYEHDSHKKCHLIWFQTQRS